MCIMVLSASDAFINWAILLFDRILSILFRCDRILIFLELDWGEGVCHFRGPTGILAANINVVCAL